MMINNGTLICVCVIIAFFLYGLKKFHLKYSLCLLSPKDKVTAIGIIGVQYIVLMLMMLLQQDMNAWNFAAIEISYLLFEASEVLMAMAARNAIARLKWEVNLCYVLIVIVLDYLTYIHLEDVYEICVYFGMAMIAYCTSVCIKEKFTVRKGIYITIVLFGVLFATQINHFDYFLLVNAIKNIVLAVLMGWCFTKVKRLRVEIRNIGVVVWIFLTVMFQYLSVLLFRV